MTDKPIDYDSKSFAELQTIIVRNGIWVKKRPSKRDLIEAIQQFDIDMKEYIRCEELEKKNQKEIAINIQESRERKIKFEAELTCAEERLMTLKDKEGKTAIEYEEMIKINELLLEVSRSREGCGDNSY
jgi:hypothetical protein